MKEKERKKEKIRANWPHVLWGHEQFIIKSNRRKLRDTRTFILS